MTVLADLRKTLERIRHSCDRARRDLAIFSVNIYPITAMMHDPSHDEQKPLIAPPTSLDAESFGVVVRSGYERFANPLIDFLGEVSGRGRDGVRIVWREVCSGGERLLHLSGDVAALSVDVVGKGFESLLTKAGSAIRALGHSADESLDAIAGDPSKKQGLSERGVRIGIGLLPIIGNTQAYGQARVKYRNAEQIEDLEARERELHEARRNCLIASTALSLEVVTLGLSGKVDLVLKVIGAGISVLNTGKAVREETEKSEILPRIDLDFISKRADWALRRAVIRDAMDFLLRLDLKDVEAGTHMSPEDSPTEG